MNISCQKNSVDSLWKIRGKNVMPTKKYVDDSVSGCGCRPNIQIPNNWLDQFLRLCQKSSLKQRTLKSHSLLILDLPPSKTSLWFTLVLLHGFEHHDLLQLQHLEWPLTNRRSLLFPRVIGFGSDSLSILLRFYAKGLLKGCIEVSPVMCLHPSSTARPIRSHWYTAALLLYQLAQKVPEHSRSY